MPGANRQPRDVWQRLRSPEAVTAELARMDLAAMRSDFDWFKARRLIASPDATFEAPIDTSFVDFAHDYLQKK